ncbi:MAG TPA: hypothetical protein EYP59_12540 [Thiotrichaceae bacterium]|nr:hypothetical protein [Thiotrichaceae bacterium]
MRKIKLLLLSVHTILLITLPRFALAGSLGTHCWQQAPFAHVLCFEINDVNGRYFSLIGETIVENAEYPLHGSALLDNKNNVFRLSFTQNMGETFVFENAVSLDPTTLKGTWTDDGGNAGEFQYLGLAPLNPDKLKAITTRRANTQRIKK